MTERPGPRARLLKAARDLTYSHGLHVGVDAILGEAEVARGSLYQHFGGKDQLIAEALDTTETLTRLGKTMDAVGDDPAARILAAFDDLRTMTADPSFRGCRYTAAEHALPDPAHPVHAVVRSYKQQLHAKFEAELVRLGHSAPSLGATQLALLVDGVLAHALTRPESHPAEAARWLAQAVISNSTHTEPTTT